MEAAIDIRCTTDPTFSFATIRALSEHAFSEFDIFGEVVEMREELSPDGGRQTSEKPLGLALQRRTDVRDLLQVQTGGLTYSRTEPYERWESFRDEAKKLWRIYADVAQPQLVSRISVRYINRLLLGDVIPDLAAYLRIYPVLSGQVRVPPGRFFLQVHMPQGDGGAVLVNLSTVENVEKQETAVLLDLQSSITPDAHLDDEAVWNLVERMHVFVGEAFEASITDKMRELIR